MYVIRPDDVRYDYSAADSLLAHAERAGENAAAAFVRLVVETRGRVVLNRPILNENMEAVGRILEHPNIVLGLGDSGAHVGQIMDASLPTFFLSHWVRDMGRFTIEEGVRRLTSEPAQLFGLAGRGVVAPGAAADLNVFSLDDLALEVPELVSDFPGGARRFIQKSRGYQQTIVNGEIFMEGLDHSGALAGQMLRSGK
jgi:N-acyl-D-aspartate/D-glutamate deacylase